MHRAILISMVSCGSITPPPGDECGDIAYGQPMISCVIRALNAAMGCVQYVENGPGKLINPITESNVEIEFTDQEFTGEAGVSMVDQNGLWHIKITSNSPWPWIVAGTLMHEVGHTLEIRFVDNKKDKYHSLNQDDIMFSGSVAGINSETMKEFVKQIRDPSSISSKNSCL